MIRTMNRRRMKRYKSIGCILLFGWSVFTTSAKADNAYATHTVEVEATVGANFGGTSPLPLPAEIRKIRSFNPRFNPMAQVSAIYWMPKSSRWGVSAGLRIESKGMNTGATVKNYGMEIIQDESRVSGNWTGKVRTHYQSTQLSIPVLANFRLNDRLRLSAGPYVSYALHNDFSGVVFDGYLREGDPTGNKVVFDGDTEADYEFSSDLRRFQWGLQCGASWLAFDRFSLQADLTWGLNDVFKSSFKTVTFSMYPIYLRVGVGYLF